MLASKQSSFLAQPFKQTQCVKLAVLLFLGYLTRERNKKKNIWKPNVKCVRRPMAKPITARLREAFEYSVIFLMEKVDDNVADLSEEDGRDIDTFDALKKSIRAVPHDLIEQTIQLRVRDGQAFENSLTAMCAAVCDTFRPANAAEFLAKGSIRRYPVVTLSLAKARARIGPRNT